MKIIFLSCSLIFFSFSTIFGQVEPDTIVAKSGDGIFSMLRSAGIHPIKYYVDFLDLNQANIKGASELVVGQSYILPSAPDSYKNMGVKIDVDAGEETPIFLAELAQLKERDSTLKNTVYYIMYANGELNSMGKENELDSFLGGLAKNLLERGARVYLLPKTKNLGNTSEDVAVENSQEVSGKSISVVNKKYLRHYRSYQRVLIVRDIGENKKGTSLSLHYYDKNVQGQNLAESLREVFAKDAIHKTKSLEGMSPFVAERYVYLAKNIVPPITTLLLNGEDDVLKLRADKSSLSNLIIQGILNDYAVQKKAN